MLSKNISDSLLFTFIASWRNTALSNSIGFDICHDDDSIRTFHVWIRKKEVIQSTCKLPRKNR